MSEARTYQALNGITVRMTDDCPSKLVVLEELDDIHRERTRRMHAFRARTTITESQARALRSHGVKIRTDVVPDPKW